MRGGLIVVGICLVASVAIAMVLKNRYAPEIAQTQDLVTGLIYFLEQNEQRFPASEAEFLASDFVEHLPGGGFRIRARPDSAYRRETYGIPIASLAPFKIRWGTDLSTLSVDERGKVRDAEGKDVALVIWPSSPPSGKGYSWILLGIREEMLKRKQAGAPAAASGPAAP